MTTTSSLPPSAYKRFRRQVHATILTDSTTDWGVGEVMETLGHGSPTNVYRALCDLVEAGLADETTGQPLAVRRRFKSRGHRPTPGQAVAEALKGAVGRVEEYLRQFERQTSVDITVIHTVWTDPETEAAELTPADLKTICTLASAPRLKASEARELHSLLEEMELATARGNGGHIALNKVQQALELASRLV